MKHKITVDFGLLGVQLLDDVSKVVHFHALLRQLP